MSENARPECVSEIAAIFAKGFLRYRKSRRLLAPEPPQSDLASARESSRHVTVVNDQRGEQGLLVPAHCLAARPTPKAICRSGRGAACLKSPMMPTAVPRTEARCRGRCS